MVERGSGDHLTILSPFRPQLILSARSSAAMLSMYLPLWALEVGVHQEPFEEEAGVEGWAPAASAEPSAPTRSALGARPAPAAGTSPSILLCTASKTWWSSTTAPARAPRPLPHPGAQPFQAQARCAPLVPQPRTPVTMKAGFSGWTVSPQASCIAPPSGTLTCAASITTFTRAVSKELGPCWIMTSFLSRPPAPPWHRGPTPPPPGRSGTQLLLQILPGPPQGTTPMPFPLFLSNAPYSLSSSTGLTSWITPSYQTLAPVNHFPSVGISCQCRKHWREIWKEESWGALGWGVTERKLFLLLWEFPRLRPNKKERGWAGIKQYWNIKKGSRSENHDKPFISAGIRSLTM